MIRRTISIIFLATLASMFNLQAQSLSEAIREDHARAASNHHSYDYVATEDTPAPAGYTPFYISHFARHGSRYDGGMHNVERALRELQAADSAGILTPLGKQLLAAEELFAREQRGYEGMLTKVGFKEHQQMAERMYARFKPVFKQEDRPHVAAISTFVPRTIMSMTAFTDKLNSKNKSLRVTLASGDDVQASLTTHGGMKHATDLFNEAKDSLDDKIDTRRFYKSIFTDVKKAKTVIKPSADNFVHYIFVTTEFSECASIPELAPENYFTEDELIRLAVYQNAKNYYYTRQVYLKDGRPGAADMVELFIRDADAAVAGNDVAADLRFGHDIQIGVILPLLGEEDLATFWPATQIADHYSAGLMLCMGTNMQLIFYRNAEGDVLMKLLHNEREKMIPELTPVSGPYYRWPDVRAYWLERTSGRVPVEKWAGK